MSENEKLRALLAEARSYVKMVAPCSDPFPCGHYRCELLNGIDAALAEPVMNMEASASRGWQMADSLHLSVKEQRERAEKAERERDEARAEVRRTYKELSEAIAREAEAYERGAEAMREAAASCVGSDTALLQTYRSVLEGRIRALPLPEDKP
jgi:phage-related tail protein